MEQTAIIETQRVNKFYGPARGITDVSFTVEGQGITGILGPNGAGKSTLFRILAGYMPATSGTVEVGGLDIFKNSLKVRKLIGYMPENVPLYPEMRVVEYLSFRAALKEIPRRERRARIDECMRLCGVSDVAKRVVGHLSKGYRQRLGLAAALLHEPRVLILDEPGIGLDPTQVRELRTLLKEYAREHTILISSHILSEIELLCDNVLIINGGAIVARGNRADLAREAFGKGITIHLVVKGDIERLGSALREVAGVGSVSIVADSSPADISVRIEPSDDVDEREHVSRAVCAAGGVILEMRREFITLESIFAQLVGTDHRHEVSGDKHPAAAESPVIEAMGEDGGAG